MFALDRQQSKRKQLSSQGATFSDILQMVVVTILLCLSQVASAYASESEKEFFRIQQFVVGQYTFAVRMPEGLELQVLAVGLEFPRVLHFSGDRLFIGSRSGKVYLLDPPYDEARILVELANYPHSVVVHNGQIFIAQTDGVYVADYAGQPVALDESDFKLLVKLPGGQGHNSRTLKVGPDGRFYVSLGIAGNCSDQYLHSDYPFDDQRGGFFSFDPSESPPQLEPFASGLRNPVGFDWHPVTKELYANNNGPDHLGYNQPREIFARVTKDSFHGMPWYQLDDEKWVEDSCIKTAAPRPVSDISKPVATFPARIAPMDMVFLGESVKAHDYVNDAIVALHGSWATSNGRGDGEPSTRREPKLVRVNFQHGQATGVTDFLTGFQLANGARWARPMGVAIGPDGDIYFSSDDGIHGLYRLRSIK